MNGLYILSISLIYCLLLIGVYFSKKRLTNIENKLFIILLIINFFGIILDISSIAVTQFLDNELLKIIVAKSYLLYLLTWITIFTIYIFVISKKDRLSNNKSFRKYYHLVLKWSLIPYGIFILLTIISPLYFYHVGTDMYSYGPATNIIFIVSSICMVVWIVSLIRNYKNIRAKKYWPLFAFIFLGAIVMIIQKMYPTLLLMTSAETFVTFMMYFTIENPDLQLIEELNIARDQAERANEAKTEFLSSMSHEIRTPLNAIVGFSQILEEEDLPANTRDEVRDIVIASENLLEIVNGILDISKIEANKLEIINNEYSLNRVLSELVSLTRARIGDKQLEFKTNFAKDLPQVLYGDSIRLKQIILNLLTNSVKYTKSGSINFDVNTVIKDDVCRLIISVRDTGIGIKTDDINKLFNKFQRLDVEKTITIEGTGLGLAITKKLVELMQGKIVVQSTYGEGSCFTVAIDQKIIPSSVEKQQILQQENKINIFDGSNKRVLLVDDNKINLKVASRLLDNYSIQTVSVLSGQECLDLIKNNEYFDLILLDDMMPHMSGVDTFKILKQNPDFNIPTVILTANAISGMREKYLSDGFSDYLSKPIDRKELDRVLHNFLNKEE